MFTAREVDYEWCIFRGDESFLCFAVSEEVALETVRLLNELRKGLK